jgi:hypothetical protein
MRMMDRERARFAVGDEIPAGAGACDQSENGDGADRASATKTVRDGGPGEDTQGSQGFTSC